MRVPGTENLVYFAYPKSASEWMRHALKLLGTGITDKYSQFIWDECDIDYYHVQPKRWISHYGDTFEYFTVVRNTYARLVSCWRFGIEKNMPYAKGYTRFDLFIRHIHRLWSQQGWSHPHLKMKWMYLPIDIYFEGVIDKVRLFEMSNLEEVVGWLANKGVNTELPAGRIINGSCHRNYEQYYTKDMADLVYNMYKWEIDTFHYKI